MDIKDLVKEEINKQINSCLKQKNIDVAKKVSKFVNSPEFKKFLQDSIRKQATYWIKNDYDFFDNVPESVMRRIETNVVNSIFK